MIAHARAYIQDGQVKCACDPDKGALDQPFNGGYCTKFYYFRPGRQVTLDMDVSNPAYSHGFLIRVTVRGTAATLFMDCNGYESCSLE